MTRGPLGWRLVVFYGELADEASASDAKTVPDFESAGACWVSSQELDSIPLR